MPELPEQIASLIDGAAPGVTLDEVQARAERNRHRRFVRGLTGGAALVIVVAIASVLVFRPDDDHPSVVVAPSTTTTPIAQPADGQVIGGLRSDAINVQTNFLQGIDPATLTKGPGHDPQTPLPGQPGNVVIYGHRTTYTHPFFDLEQLRAHDRIEITIGNTSYLYAVTSQLIVDADDLDATLRGSNAALSLVANNPKYAAKQRLIVSANAAGTLTTHIEVASPSVKGGGSLTADVVIDNETGAPLRLTDPNGCRTSFALGLGNDAHPAQIGFTTSCLPHPLTIAVGTHRFPFTLSATESACSTASQSPTMPECVPGGGLPPLPPGDYFVSFFDDGTHLPVPTPLPVTVVP